jgi:hypothetical protein
MAQRPGCHGLGGPASPCRRGALGGHRGGRHKQEWTTEHAPGKGRGDGSHRGGVAPSRWRRRPVRRMATRGRAAPVVACGEEEVGEARNAPRFLEQQRGGPGGHQSRRIDEEPPTMALFTTMGNNWKCGGLGGS